MEIRIPLNNTLREGSKNYYENVQAYVKWNEAHDKEEKIADYLWHELLIQDVLEIGCGNGKYAQLLNDSAWTYTGIDISAPQLKIASQINATNLSFKKCSAEKTPFENESFDSVLSVWGAISVVKDLRRKKKILNEAMRVLRKGGAFYVVRDDFTGEWVRIKRRQKSRRGYNWLLANGFKVVKRIKTSYEFESKEEAKALMHSLFGRKVSAYINKRVIKHNVMILKKVKQYALY